VTLSARKGVSVPEAVAAFSADAAEAETRMRDAGAVARNLEAAAAPEGIPLDDVFLASVMRILSGHPAGNDSAMAALAFLERKIAELDELPGFLASEREVCGQLADALRTRLAK
jgi:hypothetical protein